MYYTLSLLSVEDIAKIKEAITKLPFSDGKNSARGKAKDIKNNWQIVEGTKGSAPMFNGLKVLLLKNEKIAMVAQPKYITNIMVNKYGVGDTYGWHVDHAHMNSRRTDLSFTVFLNDPSEYDGGELQIRLPTGQIMDVKLEPGKMVLYSTGLLHRVTPVTKGERLCIVGWMQSFIKDDSDRHMMVRLQTLFSELRGKEGVLSEEQYQLMNELQFQLIRRLSN
jgi:PKHD-type hydroxylase